ncbi:MAG: hypothetical protein J6I85_03110 [Clostridia bacterium]|nr:hypothetical protein [Clostridia bacterium]
MNNHIMKKIKDLNPGVKIREIDFLVMKSIISEQPLVLPEGYMINKDGFLTPCSGELPIKVEIVSDCV